MKKQSVGNIVLAVLVALIAALLSPLGLVTPFTMLAVLGVPVVLVWLYAWAGVIPAAVFGLCSLGMTALMGSTFLTAVTVPALYVPPIVALWCIRSHRPYWSCVRVSVIAQVAGVLAALLLAWLWVRQDLVDAAIAVLGERLNAAPSTMMDQILLLYGQMGMLPGAGIDFAKGYLDTAERALAIERYLATAADGMKIALPALLLTSGVTTGICSAVVPIWIWARRGDERGVRRVPLAEWRMPRNAAIGLPLCVVVAYVMARMGVAGGDAVLYAAWYLLLLLCRLQALGAVSRLMKARGHGRGWRVAMLVLLLTLARDAAHVIGAASLYFGSQGVISTWIRNKRQENDGEDE